ncbi:hypothetical protein HOY80DRAFT_960718 [Tuber brumale]|nr:hypothetical protein HOY80DRAFT_960718 [Tuber brumale]
MVNDTTSGSIRIILFGPGTVLLHLDKNLRLANVSFNVQTAGRGCWSSEPPEPFLTGGTCIHYVYCLLQLLLLYSVETNG